MTTKAYSPCWVCGRKFWYVKETVPSVPVDRVDEPVDDVRKAYRKAPICPVCFEITFPVNKPVIIPDTPEEPTVVTDRNSYMVLNGMIIRTTWRNPEPGLVPMAGLPDTIQPNPAPEPHIAARGPRGQMVCEPWCWCEIEKYKARHG